MMRTRSSPRKHPRKLEQIESSLVNLLLIVIRSVSIRQAVYFVKEKTSAIIASYHQKIEIFNFRKIRFQSLLSLFKPKINVVLYEYQRGVNNIDDMQSSKYIYREKSAGQALIKAISFFQPIVSANIYKLA